MRHIKKGNEKMKLTQEMIDAGLPVGKHFTGCGTGLYVKVNKGGSTQWVQRVVVNGKRREMGMGSPRYVPLEDATITAKANKIICMRGGDPIEVRNMS
jgi:hypothetical protein